MLRTAPYIYADDLTVPAPAPTHLRASRSNQTTKRRHTQDEELFGELATGTTGRVSRAQYQQRRRLLQPVPSTYDDGRVASGQYQQLRPKQNYIGVGMLIALFFLLLYWIVGTWGAAFWVTHITDPTTYG